ncbi:MAG: MarR family transcriptional regulator [Spirochaetales bacterium]|nr:MarR family transcriptional regulator [Spirochaetales bacterium]
MKAEFPDREDSALESVFDLKRLMDKIYFKDYEKTYKLPEGLNFTHVKAVMILRFQGHCTMSQLSSLILLEKGSFTPVAARLMEQGVIRKEHSPEDKRVQNLVLTDIGKELADRISKTHIAYTQAVIARLDPDEQMEYLHLIGKLNKMNKKLLEAGADDLSPCFE